MAKACKFYGWLWSEVENMNIGIFMRYYDSIEILEAQDLLVQYTLQDWSNLKKEVRQKMHRETHKKAYPKTWKKKKAVTLAELSNIIGK